MHARIMQALLDSLLVAVEYLRQRQQSLAAALHTQKGVMPGQMSPSVEWEPDAKVPAVMTAWSVLRSVAKGIKIPPEYDPHDATIAHVVSSTGGTLGGLRPAQSGPRAFSWKVVAKESARGNPKDVCGCGQFSSKWLGCQHWGKVPNNITITSFVWAQIL